MERKRGWDDFGRARVIAACALVATLALATLASGTARAQDGTDDSPGPVPGTLSVVGVMPATAMWTDGTQPYEPTPLAVDGRRDLGFSVGGTHDDPEVAHIAMYDLRTGRTITEVTGRLFSGNDPAGRPDNDSTYPQTHRWMVDSVHGRFLVPEEDPSNTTPSCSVEQVGQGLRPSFFRLVSYGVDGSREHGTITQQRIVIPCGGVEMFYPLAGSHHAPSDRFYVTGDYRRDVYGIKGVGAQVHGLQQNQGDHLVVAQMRLDEIDGMPVLSHDWAIDLQTVGCGRRGIQFVARSGNSVIAYCSDLRVANAKSTGGQGYVVQIPLDGDAPVLRGDKPVVDPATGAILNAVVRRTPALSGRVVPILDPVSGTVLLTTNDSTNGSAVWVFDPKQERFVGVITGGFADQPPGNTAVGFDPVRGRVYLLTKGGVLVARVRGRPLAPGELVGVLANTESVEDFVFTPPANNQLPMEIPTIGVTPGSGLLFVPVRVPGACPGVDGPCARYVVLQDDLPDPPKPEKVDLDRFTTQVDDEPGRTVANSSAGASAVGGRVLVTGGIPRIVSQLSPTCVPVAGEDQDVKIDVSPLLVERQLFGGSCTAEQVFTPGHRDWLFAPASLTLGTAQGVTAEASGFAVAPGEFATDNDIRRASDCHETTVRSLGTAVERFFTEQGGGDQGDEGDEGGEGDAPGRSPVCEAVQDAFTAQTGDDLGQGTRGGTSEEPGEGFPVRHAHCDDFGSGATTEEQPTESDDDPRGLTFASNVMCDLARVAGEASAASRAFSIAPPGTPGLTVARTAAQATSAKTGEGQVTTVTATAEGVVVGPLQIGKVYTQAVTKARGHTGRASTNLTRLWCGVAITGVAVEHCIDPTTDENQAAIDDLNQGLQRLRITVPRANGEDANGEATPGGYQAVVTKAPEVRAADSAVNDDDSHTVPGLQATFYNDGAEGRSRVVVQLAGVHAESRYGIVQIPQFTSPGFTLPTSLSAPAYSDGGFVPPRPGRLVGAAGYDEFLVEHPVLTARDESTEVLMDQVRRAPFGALRNFLNWLVNHPREAALLFVMWALLSFPVYLIVRRRSFEFVAAMEASFP